MLAQAFVQHALLAGTFVALACGLVGYFIVLRAQMFAGDALSHVALTGALGAAAFGVDVRLGLFAATALVACGMGVLGRRARADDVVIGSVFAWVLGLGALFLWIFTTTRSGGGGAGTAAVHVLFGSLFGLDAGTARIAAAVAISASIALGVIARPLLFASLDAPMARARGVPVRVLDIAFLLLVAVVAAEATQAVGALLLLGLLAGPAGASHRLTTSPYPGLALAGAFSVLAMWTGLAISVLAPPLPPSSAVVLCAAVIYALAVARSHLARRRSRAGALVSSSPSPSIPARRG